MTRPLTPREQQVMALIWDGLTTKEIGATLQISVKTAEAHRTSLMRKLRANNTAQLITA